MAKQPDKRAADKARRLAKALRANLKRRKQQAKTRADKAEQSKPADPEKQ